MNAIQQNSHNEYAGSKSEANVGEKILKLSMTFILFMGLMHIAWIEATFIMVGQIALHVGLYQAGWAPTRVSPGWGGGGWEGRELCQGCGTHQYNNSPAL